MSEFFFKNEAVIYDYNINNILYDIYWGSYGLVIYTSNTNHLIYNNIFLDVNIPFEPNSDINKLTVLIKKLLKLKSFV